MAYATNTQVKAFLKTSGSGDDALLTTLIERAQKRIDSYCKRTFEASGDTTRNFDAQADVEGRVLHLDFDLCAITSVTNGDGVLVSSSDYVKEPRNSTPWFALTLKASADVSWTYDDSPENAIAIVGRWAYSTTPPVDVVDACIRLTAWVYRQKDNPFDIAMPQLTSDGPYIMPEKLPADVGELLKPYRRLG